MALTWHPNGHNSAHAMNGELVVGQIVRYDQDPAWAAFLNGIRIGTGRVATEAEAKARVERAWEGQQARRA